MVGKKRFSPNCVKSPESLELVLSAIFEFGKAQLDSCGAQRLVQLFKNVGRGDVHAGDGLCGNNHPARGRGRSCRGLENTLFEQLGVREEQGRIPAKENQAGYPARVRIARDVVVALDAFGLSQHRECGRQPSQRNSMTAIAMARPMPRIAPKTATPTKQTMDSQNSQRWMRKIRARSVTSISPMAEAMTTAANAASGRCWSEIRRHQQQQGNGKRTGDSVNCVRAPRPPPQGFVTNCC